MSQAAEDEERTQIVSEEERVLLRIQKHLQSKDARIDQLEAYDYETELLSLRDQIGEARLEDVPPLVEEMERLQAVASRRAQVASGYVDPNSPYFGRLVLQEGERKREVLIGRGTYVDPRTGIKIVDWRDAPVSRLYYRYDEGDDYEENFGGRDVYGDVLTRRSLAISEGVLRRIGCPQGTFTKAQGGWRRMEDSAIHLKGGQGAAMRADGHHKPGKLGMGHDGDGRTDKFLPEITALIDARQFELITKPDSGLVVIQGGAGSGKTTIGLHRLAYLNFQDPKRFRPDKMLIVVFNDALARYISKVLPSLGVGGVQVATFESWAKKQRRAAVPSLPTRYSDETPLSVTKLKKHPAMLKLIDQYVARSERKVGAEVDRLLKDARDASLDDAWLRSRDKSLSERAEGLLRALPSSKTSLSNKHLIERVCAAARHIARDLVSAWHEILTDKGELRRVLLEAGGIEPEEINMAASWCSQKCALAVVETEERAERREEQQESAVSSSSGRAAEQEREAVDELKLGKVSSGASDDHEEREHDRSAGIDGVSEISHAELDIEDDALLLYLAMKLRGGLSRGRELVDYSHILIDEAQDLSPVELAVILGTVSVDKSPARPGQPVRTPSVTLAGDTAQRLLMDNGFSDWKGVLGNLGLDHVAVEPLRVAYRSTAEIVNFSREVLGPLAPKEEPVAIRSGAPVELFQFAHSGEAVGFLAEALRELAQGEPRSSIAVISRFPEHAEMYAKGLVNAEVPNLRRIANQDFPFKAGVDVTDVRQVKGLEFDYVVLIEVNGSVYPADDESRHLLHIAATRAAHQLWVLCVGKPSPLLPQSMRDRAY